MIIKEYRVVLPIAYEEVGCILSGFLILIPLVCLLQYPIAHGYTTAEFTRQDLQLGDRIEIVEHTPLNDLYLPDGPGYAISGQYIHKIYHLKRQVPRWAKILAPKELLIFHEKMWNSFPFARAEFSNPGYLKDKLFLRLDTICMPDRGDSPNAHRLTPDQLTKREVIYLDIANDPISAQEYREQFDPKKFTSQKTGRGPLRGKWQDLASPIMCCYKLLIMDFKWLGLQEKVEKYANEMERKIFHLFYRQLFCWIDDWHGMNLEELQKLETEVVRECNQSIRSRSQNSSSNASTTIQSMSTM